MSPRPSDDPARGFRADSLALGMAVMLAMTVLQRGVGFARGIWFCRLLDDALLGRWAMAFGFLTLATPALLLGLPGSLIRYVEVFRRSGHLPAFVGRIALVSAALVVLGIAAMAAAPQLFGWLIFRDAAAGSLVASVTVALATIVAFNFCNELVSALRQVRVVSAMQFLHSLAFTILGVAWLLSGGGLAGLVAMFAVSAAVGMLPGLWVLARNWGHLPRSSQPLDSRRMWHKILPYAAALWAMNVLTNAFELSDRYMILHFAPGGSEVGQGLVGQYHSGRLIPMLLLSLAMLISGTMMPYLTADWESGRRRRVVWRLKRTLLGISAAFTAGSAVALLVAPWLFETLLSGRYGAGLAVMPLAFVFCTWGALALVAQDYLWCAEKGRWVGAVMAVGLLANLVLNHLLLPRWGLPGAVMATLLANLIVLLGIQWLMAREGYPLDLTAFWATTLPATLLAGPVVAGLSVVVTLAASTHARRWLRPLARAAGARRGAFGFGKLNGQGL